MTDVKKLARVILRPDGLVHIVFRDIRSVYATAESLLEFFSDPIEFIEIKSSEYKDSTFETNRKRVGLDDVLGVTLAYVNSDKQIVCNFPELFQYIFLNIRTDDDKKKKIDMSSFEFETILPDEKSFLLRYYFEFAKTINPTTRINRNINLRKEVQFEIVKEIINICFENELPSPTPVVDLSNRIIIAENEKILQTKNDNSADNKVTVNQYAKIIGCSPQTVYSYIKDKRLKSVTMDETHHYWIDKDDRPINWDRHKGANYKYSLKDDGSGKRYARKREASAADVEEHILKFKLFSAAIAPYIHTFEELDYYTKRNYHEVNWHGRSALIIDVNPDYISSEGIKNRDLMKEGKAPVFPDKNKEKYRYELHHIGQRATSPLCIVPSFDHNSKNMSKIFHHCAPDPELSRPEFELQKSNFWKKYIEEYDKVDRFYQIPYLNSPRKNGKKK